MKTQELIKQVLNKLPLIKGLTRDEKEVITDALRTFEIELKHLDEANNE